MNIPPLEQYSLRKKIMVVTSLIVFVVLLVWGITLPPFTSEKEAGVAERKTPTTLSVSGSEKKPFYQSLTSPEEQMSSGGAQETRGSQTLADFFTGRSTQEESRGAFAEAAVPSSESDKQILREYGNKAGEIIRHYTDTSLDEAVIFKVFVENRESETAQQQIQKIAAQYMTIAEQLDRFEADPLIARFHTDLAKGYNSVGLATAVLSSSNLEAEDFFTYNESLPIFIDGYMGVALFLRVHGVAFSPSEPGYLFTLNL
jgi:hypothetical protein